MISFLRRRRFRITAGQAEAAMACGDWQRAAVGFAQALTLMPQRSDLRVQYGHALKELGQSTLALEQYALAKDQDDAVYHFVSLNAQNGDMEAASKALVDLLHRSPNADAAYLALRQWGLASFLPSGVKDDLRKVQYECLARDLKESQKHAERMRVLAEASLEDYGEVRAQMLAMPPFHHGADDMVLNVFVDARQTQPAFVRSTLLSLRQSLHQRWKAVVIASSAVYEHPVASLADLDDKIHFVRDEREVEINGIAAAALYVSAGTCLDPVALSWIAYAMASTEATACMCDWDHCVSSWNGPDRYFDPKLHGQFDIEWLMTTDFPPPLIAMRQDEAGWYALSPEKRRECLAAIFLAGRQVVHIPRPLAAVAKIPERAEQARELGECAPIWSTAPGSFPPAPGVIEGVQLRIDERVGRPPVLRGVAANPSEMIRVIVPTRDCAELLDEMVKSLLDCAVDPELVCITVINNRSVHSDTMELLRHLEIAQNVDIMTYDAPFNWSLMNNVAVEQSSEPLIVFANNDMRMLTRGWDQSVRDQLSRSDVGVLGARLLYPDGTIQHAGMLMGLADGSPVHDGVFGVRGSAQSQERFDRSRTVPAVTGAFMALRRSLFDKLGGFDADRFAIAYNDVDLCLAARAAGFRILYDPAIELIHYESKTRGFNDNRAKIAWDQGELRSLFRKWGAMMIKNPTVSPWWSDVRPYSVIDISSAVDTLIL